MRGISTQGEVEMWPRDVLFEREVKGMLEIFCFYTFLCTSKICLKEKASFKPCKSAKVRMRLTFMPARPLPLWIQWIPRGHSLGKFSLIWGEEPPPGPRL